MSFLHRFLSIFLLICFISTPLKGITSCDTLAKNSLELSLFDQIMLLIDDIEHGKTSHFDADALKKISEFIGICAQTGVSDHNFMDKKLIEQDIIALLSPSSYEGLYTNKWQLGFYSFDDFEFIPCSWVSDKWKDLKKFVKKHKTAIIVGATVIVATTVAILAITHHKKSASNLVPADKDQGSAAGIAALGAAALSGIAADTGDFPHQKIEVVEELIHEKIDDIKDILLEETALVMPSCSLQEKTREIGSLMAHEILDGVAELVSTIPEAVEEVQQLAEKFLSFQKSGIEVEDNSSPRENYEKLISKGHKKIDKAFSTELGDCYTKETKNLTTNNDRTLGMLPAPGMIANIPKNKLIMAGLTHDRGGFTAVGRSLTKHGYRENSYFPKPAGNIEQINQQGRILLEKILNEENVNIEIYKHPRFGEVLDVKTPNLYGARFTKDGKKFIHFLEPPKGK